MLEHSHSTSCCPVYFFLIVLTLTLSLTAHSFKAMPLSLPAPGSVSPLPTSDPNNDLPWESTYSFLVLCMVVIVNSFYLVRWVIDWCCNCLTYHVHPSPLLDNHVLPLAVADSTRVEDVGRRMSSVVEETRSSFDRRVTLSSSTLSSST